MQLQRKKTLRDPLKQRTCFLCTWINISVWPQYINRTVSWDFNQPNLVSIERSWEVTIVSNGFELSRCLCAKKWANFSLCWLSQRALMVLKRWGRRQEQLSPPAQVGKRPKLVQQSSCRVGRAARACSYQLPTTVETSQDPSIDTKFGGLKSHDIPFNMLKCHCNVNSFMCTRTKLPA